MSDSLMSFALSGLFILIVVLGLWFSGLFEGLCRRWKVLKPG